ncbi:MAG: hypothetical protein PHG06_19285 [Parabacteroides sp.]|nr:hypothetical protein [Parabacteroides sp.]
MARKTVYDDSFPLLAEQYAREGMIDKEIWAKLGIARNTFYRFQNEYKEFREAIKRGKRPVDVEVEKSLLKRAVGFEYEEKTIETEIGDDGQPKPSKIKTTKKMVPPDVGAIAFWLKNRRPERWREKQEVDVTTAGESLNNKKVDIECLTEEEQQALIDISLKIEENSKK